jgi:peptide deformylase
MTTVEGYKKPHGFSGANAGIPFRIIALADGTVMINPHFIHASGRKESISNCGSLTLKEPIKIYRFSRVVVCYVDMEGNFQQVEGYLPTVQHEIDHCNGILITEREVEK